jgi:hypothetical protein
MPGMAPAGMPGMAPAGMAGAGNDGKLARTPWRKPFGEGAETLRRVNTAE